MKMPVPGLTQYSTGEAEDGQAGLESPPLGRVSWNDRAITLACLLATGTLLVLSTILVGMLPGFSLDVPPTADAILLIALQIAVFAAQFAIFFILQKRGGRVYISPLGAVAAAVGVPIAIVVLGEAPPAGLGVGGVLIAVGIALVTTVRGRQ